MIQLQGNSIHHSQARSKLPSSEMRRLFVFMVEIHYTRLHPLGCILTSCGYVLHFSRNDRRLPESLFRQCFYWFFEYRRRGSNPHMELPIPDFESGASAIPPLRRYLNCLRWCRRRRRLIDANSIRKVLGLCEDSESGCETAKSVQMESPWGQRCQNSMIKAVQSLDIGDSIDGRHGLRYFSTSLKVEP